MLKALPAAIVLVVFSLDAKGDHCRFSETLPTPSSLTFERVLPNLSIASPIQLVGDPSHPNGIFVVSKKGKIFRTGEINNDTVPAIWADLSPIIDATPSEAGLLAIAFAPDYAESGVVYAHYNRRTNGRLQSVVSRFHTSSPEAGILNIATEDVLLTLDQPFSNHNGGQIAFGPDGYLYIAFGDGGSAGDPLRYGQDLSVLFSKILRIDVSGREPGRGYLIPEDNPFVATPNARPETWAYGLRNPWQFSFDPVTGDLWAGDVGQNAEEEIDLISRGGNYGWNIMEGNSCYSPRSGCDRTGLSLPIHVYGRSEGISVTGGFVYRGESEPSLYGTYIYGDYASRKVWGLSPNGDGTYLNKELGTAPDDVSAFGRDNNGELYVLGYGSGSIYRLKTSDAHATTNRWPSKLSESGCFADMRTRQFNDLVRDYDVNVALWSDGAAKERGIRLPDEERVTYRTNDFFGMPRGTVALKTFTIGSDPIETRVLVRSETGVTGASYIWNSEGTDAFLAVAGARLPNGSSTWTVPGSGQCNECHAAARDGFLGLRADQIHRSTEDSKLLEWAESDVFANTDEIDVSLIVPLSLSTGSVSSRARHYLEVNCATCHRPGGTTQSNIDLRLSRPLSETNACETVPHSGDLGIPNARIIAPSDPTRSILAVRMLSDDEGIRMPRIGRTREDQVGVELVTQWIRELGSCGEPLRH